MLRIALRPGLVFCEGVKKWRLKKRCVNGKFLFEGEDGAEKDLTRAEVHERWGDDKWRVDERSLGQASDVVFLGTPALLDSYAEAEQHSARLKEKYLLKIEKLFHKNGDRFLSTPEKLKPHIEVVAKELRESNAPSTDAVWSWWKRFSPTRCATKLVDRKPTGRPTLLRTLGHLFDEAVGEVYLSLQKLPIKTVVERLEEKVKAFNVMRPPERRVVPPSKASVYRWVAKLYAPLVKAARKGKRVAEREYRSVVSGVKVKRILDRWELDHTPLDIILICQTTKLILGRPVLTLCIDRHSRMITGMYVGFHAASASSVLHCLKLAILPKGSILKRFPDLRGPWPACGCPNDVAVDNGMDLHAKDLEEAARELGIELHYMGAGYPELKAAIERVIGTVNRTFIHTLPGTTFSNVEQRGAYPSEKLAALDIEAFTHVLLKWIIDVYHKTPHRGLLGKTPLQVWLEGEAERVIELPAYPRQLDLIVGHAANRTVWHYGIQYDNLFYNSAKLQSLLREGIDSVRLRAHEISIAFVSVLDPGTKEYFDIPAVDLHYADGLNRHVHRLVMAMVRDRFNDDWNSEERLQVKREIQDIVSKSVASKKTADRKATASRSLVDSAEVFDSRAASNAFDSALDAAESARHRETFVDQAGKQEIPCFNVQEEAVNA